MEKTKFGLSYGLTAAVCYLSGIVSLLLLAVLTGIVLYFEDNKVLRFNVLQAFILTLIITVIINIINAVNILFIPDTLFVRILVIVKILVLIYGAAKSLDNYKVKLPVITDWLEKFEF